MLIKILGKPYEIKLDPMMSGEKLHGECDSATLTIRVATGLKKELAEETLLHEILHALIHETGLSQDILKGDKEEQFVARMSPALYSILDELQYLMKKIHEKM